MEKLTSTITQKRCMMSDLYQSKKTGNSPRVTLGDPKEVSNQESAKEVNSINMPQIPKEK
ncbi:hypothetical protein [Sporomusa termitida]|uniref:hypothetical protein n=1 Tax=Sporomusa termitida TaxID=2377 RepID=UPI0014796DCD|nr:hypothetical protein [Sporomusa termitida]